MNISAEMVRKLREETGAGMMDCKSALVEAAGDSAKPRATCCARRASPRAAKKAGRTASEGIVGHYIHPGAKIGVLVEVNCETDFVAKTPEFHALVKDIAMHVAAASPASPLYVSKDEVPAEMLEKEKEIYRPRPRAQGKPAAVAGEDRRGQAEGATTPPSACSSSPSSRTPRSRSASSCRRRSPSSRRTSWCGASHVSASARRVAAEPGPPRRIRPSRPLPGCRVRIQHGAKEAPRYKRVLLKLSGEALLGEKTFGIDRAFTDYLAREIKGIHALGLQIAAVVGRREHLPRRLRQRAGHGPRLRRPHGDAGHGHQRPRPAGRPRAGQRLHPRALGHRDARGRRALHPPPRHPPHGEGARRHLRRRHRQPLLLHRHRGRPARDGGQGRDHPQGHQGRRHLRRRPAEEPEGQEVRPPHLHRGPAEGPQGHGHHGHLPLHGQPAPDRRLRPPQTGAACGAIVMGEKIGTIVEE